MTKRQWIFFLRGWSLARRTKYVDRVRMAQETLDGYENAGRVPPAGMTWIEFRAWAWENFYQQFPDPNYTPTDTDNGA